MSAVTFNKSLRAAALAMQREAREAEYKNDPVLWAEEVLGVVLWSKQKEILRSIANNKRTAVKSCHSIGKTFICAVAACWWVSTHEDTMIQSTAPTYQQVHGQLWEEIRKAHLKANLRGRVTLGDKWQADLRTQDGRVKEILIGEGKKPADSNIHGFHGTHRPDGVFAILDEGCGIARAIFTGAEAITTGMQDRQLTTGNPDDPNTEFGEIFRDQGHLWNLITVSAFDTPHFTGEAEELREWAAAKDKRNPGPPEDPTPYTRKVETLLGGMPNPHTVEQQKALWGEESARYLSKVLAEFPMTSVDSLFTAAEIATGLSNTEEPTKNAFRIMGVDPARYGEDKATIVTNIGGKVEVIAAYNTMDTMELAATVHKYALDLEIDEVRVDGVGVGGGVVDRLVQLARNADNKYVVVEMSAGGRAPDPSIHRNARAYWYDALKYQLRAGNINLPDHKQLLQEMTGIRYEYPNGVMKIESKEDIRRRGDHSPDFVDAMVMATAPISYITDSPLAAMRAGQVLEFDLLEVVDLVSLY